MSTIGQHISNIRSLIEEFSRTPESYTDQFLYELLKGARSDLIEQQSKNFNKVSEWNWNSYVIQVEVATPFELECVPSYLIDDKCKVLKSVCKIPRTLKGRNKSLFNVYTLGNDKITLYTDDEIHLTQYDKIKSKAYSALIINGYLYIFNSPNKLRFVKVVGIYEDPTEWAECPKCNGTTVTTDPCYNIYVDDFTMDERWKEAAYTKVLKMLNIPLSLRQDTLNDGNNTTGG